VTRLDEFSPTVWLFTLGSFYVKITEVAQTNGLVLSVVKAMNWSSEKLIGLQFGQLFHKSIWSPCIYDQFFLIIKNVFFFYFLVRSIQEHETIFKNFSYKVF
jgi:hypothetical protein